MGEEEFPKRESSTTPHSGEKEEDKSSTGESRKEPKEDEGQSQSSGLQENCPSNNTDRGRESRSRGNESSDQDNKEEDEGDECVTTRLPTLGDEVIDCPEFALGMLVTHLGYLMGGITERFVVRASGDAVWEILRYLTWAKEEMEEIEWLVEMREEGTQEIHFVEIFINREFESIIDDAFYMGVICLGGAVVPWMFDEDEDDVWLGDEDEDKRD